MQFLVELIANKQPLGLSDIYMLQDLASKCDMTVEDIADKNECTDCRDWNSLYHTLRDRMESGEQIFAEPLSDTCDIDTDSTNMLNTIYTVLDNAQNSISSTSDYDDGLHDGIVYAMSIIESYLTGDTSEATIYDSPGEFSEDAKQFVMNSIHFVR